MIGRINIEVIGKLVTSKRDLNKMLKAEFATRGKEWTKRFRRLHFSNVAYQRYQYKRRKKGYNAAKKKRFGHTLPLVYTGESRRRSQSPKIKATKKGVKVILNTPVFNFRSKASEVDKRREMTTVTNDENSTLDKINTKNMEKRINRYRRRMKVR